MRPRRRDDAIKVMQGQARLDRIINLRHELAQLAGKIDWDWIDGEIAPLYSDQRPARASDPVCNRPAIAQADLRAVRRRRVRALGLRPLFPILHRGRVFPARRGFRMSAPT